MNLLYEKTDYEKENALKKQQKKIKIEEGSLIVEIRTLKNISWKQEKEIKKDLTIQQKNAKTLEREMECANLLK